MATITITVPDTMVTRIGTAFYSNFNYNGPTDAVSELNFVKLRLQLYLKAQLSNYEVGKASNTAGTAAAQQVTTDLGW